MKVFYLFVTALGIGLAALLLRPTNDTHQHLPQEHNHGPKMTTRPAPDLTHEDEALYMEYWRHSPIHPASYEAVDYSTKITDPYGIRKVALYVYEYEYFRGFNDLISIQRRESGTWGKVGEWDFSEHPLQEVSLKYNATGYPHHSLVKYIFTAINVNGDAVDNYAYFQAGDNLAPDRKVLLYSSGKLDQPEKTIDVCFIPDYDYEGDYDKFIADTEKLIYDGYHQNNMIKDYKGLWNFFYIPIEADAEKLRNARIINSETFPVFLRDLNTITMGVEAFGILHNKNMHDVAYDKSLFNEYLGANLFMSEPWNYGTAIHETAHSIFNLRDEYDASGAHYEIEPHPNVFPSMYDCQQYNLKYGWPAEDCEKIAYADWYRSKPQSVECIMHMDGDEIVPNFERNCKNRVLWYYEQLGGGQVKDYVEDEIENVYGDVPVAIIEVTGPGNKRGFEHSAELVDVRYGAPVNNVIHDGDTDLLVTDVEGKVIYETSFNSLDFKAMKDTMVQTLAVPFHGDMAGLLLRGDLELAGETRGKGGNGNKPQWENNFAINSDKMDAFKAQFKEENK